MFDNDISPRLAAMLNALDVDVFALRDKFPPDTKDVDFLERLKGSGIVLISANTSMRTNAIESRVLKQANITALYLGPFGGRMGLWRQAEWLIKHWPTIDGFARGVATGTCAEIKQNGKSRIYPL